MFGSDPTASIIVENLNEAQRSAVTHPVDIIRVVAGPGAGKTRVLTSRIAWLLSRDANYDANWREFDRKYPPKILAVTFTKKAANEMEKRLEGLLYRIQDLSDEADYLLPEEEFQQRPRGMDRVQLGTFHSICSRIMRRYGEHLSSLPFVNGSPLDGSFAIIDQSDQLRIVKKFMADMKVATDGKGSSPVKPRNILSHISVLKANDARVGRLGATNGDGKENDEKGKMKAMTERLAREIYPKYCKHLLENNSVDFDDLILLTRDLLVSREEVHLDLQRRWEHVLIDEFQDTSQVQLDLIKLLARKSLFVVGDGDQSIYSWRGANVESMMDFDREFPNVKTKFLMENYRSTANIVKAAQKVISASTTSGTTYRKAMKPIRGAGPPPRILACADGKAEATFVVGTILQMEKEDKLQASSSVAVIYRTNAQSRLIEEACVQKKVKYIVRGATGRFYSRAEIKDCLCFLRFLYNGRDESAFIRAIKTPSRGIGQVALNQFFAYHSAVTSAVESNDLESGNFSLLEVLISLSSEKNNEFPTNVDPNNYIAKRAMNNFVSFSSKMRHISEVSTAANVTSLLTEVIDHLELKQHFQAISKTQDEMDDRMSNVNELLLASEKYEGIACSQAPDSALGNFLDDISLLSDAVEEDTSQGNSNNVDECITVNLMTVHASKGMEFDAVFLIGNEEGIFPTQRAKDSGNDSVELEEERRLCYVAMTRARTHLLLTWRKEISFFGQSGQIHYRTAYRSRFLDALVAKQKRSEVKDNDSKATRQSRRPQINSNMNGTRGRRQKSFSTQTRRTSEISKASAVNRIPTRERRKPLTRYGGSRVQSSQGSGQYQQYFGKDTKSYRTTKKETIDFDKFNVDSTLFYPVGKTVSHRVHGVGTVVPPLPNKKDFVRVKFADSGFTLDFPMSGSGLE